MKVAKQLIDEGMDPEKVANMPIHFFLEIVNSKVETKKKAKSFKDIF
ncbi:phage tail assembly chaperone GT [Staphylococcus felis]